MTDLLFERFEAKLADLGLKIASIDHDGQIHIKQGDNSIQISLSNVRKSFELDGTFDHLDNLIDSIHSYLIDSPIPTWDLCKDKVFLSLFPSNHDFSDFINDPVTHDFHLYYIFRDGQQHIWINESQLIVWEIDINAFKEQVSKNMNALLDNSTIETSKLKSGQTLAFFETEFEDFKAALLFSDNLKQKVSSAIGWPIYCVLPVRDFCYMFSERDKDSLIPLLSNTVTKEYNESGYEITKEIIKISDSGIEAIGKYSD